MTIDLGAAPFYSPGDPYATDEDVRNALGSLRDRLPAWVDVAAFLQIAHAEMVDRLSRTYPDGIPAFLGAGLAIVRYAEAKLAAAEILEAIRVNLPDLGEAPARLRESAESSISDGVAGYPPGTSTPGGDADPRPSNPGPRLSSFTPASTFPDPYAELRLNPLTNPGVRFQ